MPHRISQQSLGLFVCLFTMVACGGETAETLSSASTAAATSTSITVAAGDGPTSTGGDEGDESTSTEAADDESTSTEAADVESTSTEPPVESTATTAPVQDTNTTVDSSTTTSEPLPVSSGPVPWSAAPLELADLPDVYRLEWAEAGEPTTCPFLAFEDLGPEAAEATIRRGEHDRNMLVVWDNPDGPGHDRRSEPCSDCGRGVVGLGTWQDEGNAVGPATIVWDDGSYANIATLPWVYGVSARVQPAGADCMYQLWSHIGSEHVEYLIGRLRQVTT